MAKAVRECGRTGKALPCKSAEWFDSKRVRSEQGHCKSPHGTRTKAARPIGCNARQVRETCAGVGSRAVATPTRRSVTSSGYPPKQRNVKSSTMKGASSPCQSAAAKTEPNRERPVRMGRGQLLYSRPRNQRAKGAGNYAGAGASDMPERSGRMRPTNVTAVAKSQTNRARSVAAGVVSGAGWCQPVIETPHSDESASSRTSASWTQPGQGSPGGGCVLTGGAGHHCTHERSDGSNPSQ